MSFENMGEAQQAVSAFAAKMEEVTTGLAGVEPIAQEALAMAAVLDGSAGEAARAMAAAVLGQIQEAMGVSVNAGSTAQEYAATL